MNTPTKAKQEKLEHYAKKPLTDFHQFDAFFGIQEGDAMSSDEDGMALHKTFTQELMSGSPAVRVLVTKNHDEKEVATALRKIADWIMSDDSIYAKESAPQSERVIGIHKIRDNLNNIIGDMQCHQTPVPDHCFWVRDIQTAIRSLDSYIDLVKQTELDDMPF